MKQYVIGGVALLATSLLLGLPVTIFNVLLLDAGIDITSVRIMTTVYLVLLLWAGFITARFVDKFMDGTL